VVAPTYAAAQRRFDLSSKYIFAVAPAAALFYPIALVAFYSGGRMLHSATSWERELSGWIVTLGAGILVYAVPLASFAVIYVLGRRSLSTQAEVRGRAWAHVAFASPPVFTAVGVLLYLVQSSSDYIVWATMWLAIIAVVLLRDPGLPATPMPTGETKGSVWLRSAHGLSALTIVLIFLAPHIANHLTAVCSIGLHKWVMNGLRTVYRSNAIQPALVALLMFQIASGGALLRRRVRIESDFFGSLQTASGAYLAAFILSHLTAVFVLGRRAMQVDTNWDFAIGAPAGVMGHPWNVRLVPHYSLAVFLLFCHGACGLRMVLMGHGISANAATKTALMAISLGGVIALAIMFAMLGAHVIAQ